MYYIATPFLKPELIRIRKIEKNHYSIVKNIVMNNQTKLTLCVLFVVFIFPLFLSAQTTIILRPDSTTGEDAYIESILNNTNFGDHYDFAAISWTNGGEPVDARGLIDFDLSVIPEGATINSAYLSLYSHNSPANGTHSTLSGSNESVLQRITSDWEENLVTWDKQPSATTQNEVFLPASVTPIQDYLDIDVTDLIQDMVNNPEDSYGFRLKLVYEEYYRRMIFGSSDHHDPDRRPKLEITYICSLPLADFIFEIDDLQADFISQVLNGDSFFWDFGDGATSTEKNPVHLYIDYGDYDVTLVASNVFGADSVTKTVSLCEFPVAAFESEIDIRTIFLTNTSSVADTYYWDFGDGYSSTLKDPIHEYVSEGEYLITLISYNECGSDTTTTLVSIADNQWDDQPFILIYPNPTQGEVDIKIFAENFIETDMVLFNEIGQVIKRIKLTEAISNLDLSHLQAGVYVVKLTASNIYHRSVLIIF